MYKEPDAGKCNNNHIYSGMPPIFTPLSLPFRGNVKQWNDTARDCYNLGCSCEDCFIYKTYFYNSDDTCKMKYYVSYFLNKLGAPEEKLA